MDHGPNIPYMFPARMQLKSIQFDTIKMAKHIADMYDKNDTILMSAMSPVIAANAWGHLAAEQCTASAFCQLFLATGFAFPIQFTRKSDICNINIAKTHTAQLLLTGSFVSGVIHTYLPTMDKLADFLEHTLQPLITLSYDQICAHVQRHARTTHSFSAIGAASLFTMCFLNTADPKTTAAATIIARETSAFLTPITHFECGVQYISILTASTPTPTNMQWIAPYIIPILVQHDLIDVAMIYTARVSINVHCDACVIAASPKHAFSSQWRTYVQTSTTSAILQAILFVWQDPDNGSAYIRNAKSRLREERKQDTDHILDQLTSALDTAALDTAAEVRRE